jgi:hypothetical protein
MGDLTSADSVLYFIPCVAVPSIWNPTEDDNKNPYPSPSPSQPTSFFLYGFFDIVEFAADIV